MSANNKRHRHLTGTHTRGARSRPGWIQGAKWYFQRCQILYRYSALLWVPIDHIWFLSVGSFRTPNTCLKCQNDTRIPVFVCNVQDSFKVSFNPDQLNIWGTNSRIQLDKCASEWEFNGYLHETRTHNATNQTWRRYQLNKLISLSYQQ